MDYIPDIPEDKYLTEAQKQLLRCDHEYVDFYNGAGISKRNKYIMNIPVFCKKCLDKKWLHIDVSDNDYDEDDE